MAQQREESEKKRARKLQIIVGSSIAAAFLLMLSFMFYLRSQRIARDISDALSRGDYAAALEITPDNQQARVMQRNAENLASALKARNYRKALQLDPGNAEALSMQKTAEIQLALSNGDYATALRMDRSGAVTAMLRLSQVQNSIGVKLKLLPPGVFTMGSVSDEKDENPKHEVRLTKPFLIGVHEITQEQNKQVMGTNPSSTKGENNPVDSVTWEDAMNFCRKLSALPTEKAVARAYRLPTEAEWEYACRAGTRSLYSFGDDPSELGQYAWYSNNSDSRTHSVGGKKPNAWGLYDMHGNVWEWCQDWFENYPSGSMMDPRGAASGSDRIGRGGCSTFPAESCRSAYRDWDDPSERYNLSGGFRVCLSPSAK